jgi:hypothetical protein
MNFPCAFARSRHSILEVPVPISEFDVRIADDSGSTPTMGTGVSLCQSLWPLDFCPRPVCGQGNAAYPITMTLLPLARPSSRSRIRSTPSSSPTLRSMGIFTVPLLASAPTSSSVAASCLPITNLREDEKTIRSIFVGEGFMSRMTPPRLASMASSPILRPPCASKTTSNLPASVLGIACV